MFVFVCWFACCCVSSLLCAWLVCLTFVCLFVCLFVCSFVSLFVCLFVCFYSCLFVCSLGCLFVRLCLFWCVGLLVIGIRCYYVFGLFV